MERIEFYVVDDAAVDALSQVVEDIDYCIADMPPGENGNVARAWMNELRDTVVDRFFARAAAVRE